MGAAGGEIIHSPPQQWRTKTKRLKVRKLRPKALRTPRKPPLPKKPSRKVRLLREKQQKAKLQKVGKVPQPNKETGDSISPFPAGTHAVLIASKKILRD